MILLNHIYLLIINYFFLLYYLYICLRIQIHYKYLINQDRLYCNVNNKNNLSFTCFSENDIYELVSIYNSDIANINHNKKLKIIKINEQELYPIIQIRYRNNNKKNIKTIYDLIKK